MPIGGCRFGGEGKGGRDTKPGRNEVWEFADCRGLSRVGGRISIEMFSRIGGDGSEFHLGNFRVPIYDFLDGGDLEVWSGE